MCEDVRVSIITGCLNSEQTIERTINSVIDQTYPNIEYVIIDGGSTDKTVEIIKEHEDFRKLPAELSYDTDALLAGISGSAPLERHTLSQ